MVYDPRPGWELQLSTFPGHGEDCVGSSSRVLQSEHFFTFPQSFKIFGNRQVESSHMTSSLLMLLQVRPIRVSETERRWKTYMFILINVNEFYSLSKCYQDPNEISSVYFFPFSGWREWKGREMNAQDRLLWFEMKTNNFRKKKAFHYFGDLGILADTFMN